MRKFLLTILLVSLLSENALAYTLVSKRQVVPTPASVRHAPPPPPPPIHSRERERIERERRERERRDQMRWEHERRERARWEYERHEREKRAWEERRRREKNERNAKIIGEVIGAIIRESNNKKNKDNDY